MRKGDRIRATDRTMELNAAGELLHSSGNPQQSQEITHLTEGEHAIIKNLDPKPNSPVKSGPMSPKTLNQNHNETEAVVRVKGLSNTCKALGGIPATTQEWTNPQ